MGRRQGNFRSRLSTLLDGLAEVEAANDRDISGLAIDSREIVQGDLFFALAGENAHGLMFASNAVSAGAIAIVCDFVSIAEGQAALIRKQVAALEVPVYEVSGLKDQLGIIAARFFAHPSDGLMVIGITGTNGKTSCCHFLAQALSSKVSPCGVIGTLGYGLYGALQPGRHTTPDAITVQALLAGMRAVGAQVVAMEASSHGLEQGRVSGVMFDIAVFTNLSRDHLDYHADLHAYGQAKRKLFMSPGLRYAVINIDDAWGCELSKSIPPQVELVSYGLADGDSTDLPAAHLWVRGKLLQTDSKGIEIQVMSAWGEGLLRSQLLGGFNASNLLAVLAVLLVSGMPLGEALGKLANLQTVPGRMERLGASGGQPLVVIDYAHSPDALEKVLQSLREHCSGLLWCVFGCGGDRDRGKRPLMGAAAESCADRIILTDDNPRHEDGAQIISDIVSGLINPQQALVIRDRAAAIRYVLQHAVAGDVVLIAGKGHEDYQLVGDDRLPFSDHTEVQSFFREVA